MAYKDLGDTWQSDKQSDWPLIRQLQERSEAGISTFIVFEGVDGSGKSTQIRQLYDGLVQRGLDVILTREPGGTPFSEAVRSLIFSNEMKITTEIMLFLAARIEHAEQLIKPSLNTSGRIVLCDRYIASSFSHQASRSQGDDLYELVWDLHDQASQFSSLPIPDLTIYLKLDPSVAVERLTDRSDINRLDAIDSDKDLSTYHIYERRIECMEKAFDEVELTGAQIAEIDADQSIDEVMAEILNTTFGCHCDEELTFSQRLYGYWIDFKSSCIDKIHKLIDWDLTVEGPLERFLKSFHTPKN